MQKQLGNCIRSTNQENTKNVVMVFFFLVFHEVFLYVMKVARIKRKPFQKNKTTRTKKRQTRKGVRQKSFLSFFLIFFDFFYTKKKRNDKKKRIEKKRYHKNEVIDFIT